MFNGTKWDSLLVEPLRPKNSITSLQVAANLAAFWNDNELQSLSMLDGIFKSPYDDCDLFYQRDTPWLQAITSIGIRVSQTLGDKVRFYYPDEPQRPLVFTYNQLFAYETFGQFVRDLPHPSQVQAMWLNQKNIKSRPDMS